MNDSNQKKVDYHALSKGLLYKNAEPITPSNQYKFTVAVLLRTKDRPLCLPRALKSIIDQKFSNWQLVITNDGGSVDVVENAVAPFQKYLQDRLTIIHNSTSLGMSHALNQGIDVSSSDYIVVHDDDDSWHPDFLQETVSFLKNPENCDCGGVITYSNRVLEEIKNDKIIEIERSNFNAQDNPFTRVSLFRLMMQNSFPPISFLFRRSVIDKIGYFNEDLPVLNDWDFNLRCCFHDEIGVIPKHLANYHHRTNHQNTIYGNSIIATSGLCLQFETTIRNTALRTLINSEKHSEITGLCFALGGHYLASLREPVKTDFILKNQHQTIEWIDKNIRIPVNNDINNLRTQLANIQSKIDLLLQHSAKTEEKAALS